MGDDIQAIKAGILEVADIFVVNKSDLDGADRTVRELRMMLELRHAVKAPAMDHDAHHRMVLAKAEGRHAEPEGPREWEPPILKVVAARDSGVAELVKTIEEHRAFLDETGERGGEGAHPGGGAVRGPACASGCCAARWPARARAGTARRGGRPHRRAPGGPVRARRRARRPARGAGGAMTPQQAERVKNLEERLGTCLVRPALALAALTHKS